MCSIQLDTAPLLSAGRISTMFENARGRPRSDRRCIAQPAIDCGKTAPAAVTPCPLVPQVFPYMFRCRHAEYRSPIWQIGLRGPDRDMGSLTTFRHHRRIRLVSAAADRGHRCASPVRCFHGRRLLPACRASQALFETRIYMIVSYCFCRCSCFDRHAHAVGPAETNASIWLWTAVVLVVRHCCEDGRKR